jgi:hypothetical protein
MSDCEESDFDRASYAIGGKIREAIESCTTPTNLAIFPALLGLLTVFASYHPPETRKKLAEQIKSIVENFETSAEETARLRMHYVSTTSDVEH